MNRKAGKAKLRRTPVDLQQEILARRVCYVLNCLTSSSPTTSDKPQSVAILVQLRDTQSQLQD